MGIKGLETFLRPYEAEVFGHSVPLQDALQGNILLVDFAGLLFYLLDHSSMAGPPGLEYVSDSTAHIIAQLTAFARTLTMQGIQQVWVLDGTLNPNKYDTNLSRLDARTPAICRFTERVIQACMVGDSATGLPFKSFQELTQRLLVPSLALPKFNRSQPTKYYSFRGSLESSAINSLIESLMDEGSLLGYEVTILEGDARIARIANIEQWRGMAVGAVLAQDTDFLIYDCNYISFQSLQVELRTAPGVDVTLRCNAPASASICRRGVFAKKIRDLAVDHLVDIFVQQGGLNHNLADATRAQLVRTCPVARFTCMLPDLATLCGNDYYSADSLTIDIFLGHRHISPAILSLLSSVSRKCLPKCKLSLSSLSDPRRGPVIKYSDFKGMGALLVVCCICNFDNSSPVGGLNINNPALQALIFKNGSNLKEESAAYVSGRVLYSMDSAFALNSSPIELQRSGYGGLYRSLHITSHFGRLLCGPQRVCDMSWMFRLIQFQFPSENIISQLKLQSEIVVLAAWDDSLCADDVSWQQAVREGEFLKISDGVSDVSSVIMTQWRVVNSTDSVSGYTNYAIGTSSCAMLEEPPSSMPQLPSADISAIAIKAEGVDLDIKDICPIMECLSVVDREQYGVNECRNIGILWNNQSERLHWISIHCRHLLTKTSDSRRCLLFQSLNSACVAPVAILPSIITEALGDVDGLKHSMQSVVDTLVLTLHVLVEAYGDFRGGLMKETCRLHLPMMQVIRGYIAGILYTYIPTASGVSPSNMEWFTNDWTDSAHMAFMSSMYAIHMLFHTILGHVLSMNNVFGSPLGFGSHATTVFQLNDAMRYSNVSVLPSSEGCGYGELLTSLESDVVNGNESVLVHVLTAAIVSNI